MGGPARSWRGGGGRAGAYFCFLPPHPHPASEARFLANDMEEDLEDPKCVIFLWALGKDWRCRVADFLHQRDKLWARMGFRAMVSRQCCEEVRPHHYRGVGEQGRISPPIYTPLSSRQVMAKEPSHWAWTRERRPHHGGARRGCPKARVPLPGGPGLSPPHCSLCGLLPARSPCGHQPRPLPILSKCPSPNPECHCPPSQACLSVAEEPLVGGFLIILPSKVQLQPGTYTLHGESGAGAGGGRGSLGGRRGAQQNGK